ncbi:hypothetical protein Tco_0228928 [Tanacetum coccineum]
MRRLRRNHIYGCTVTSIMERNLDQVRVTDYGKRIGVTWQPGNVKIKPDIENMTMNEYLEYEAAKERQLWDDVRSRRSPTNYNEADVDSFHRNKSKTFSYPYSHNLAPSHPCFLPVQPYLKNYLVSTNEGNDVDIESMTIAEYNLYVSKQGLGMNPLNNHSYGFTPQFFAQPPHTPNTSKKDFDFNKILDDLFRTGAENMKRIEQDIEIFNVPDEIDEIVRPLIPEPIHTTPPNDDHVAPATKSILDELLEELGDEILNITMVDDEADIIPTKDLEELEILLAKEPQSNFAEIQVDRDIISPERYDLYSSFPYPVAYLNPKGVYCYFHPHLIPSEAMDTR